jgi:hypothetical protein
MVRSSLIYGGFHQSVFVPLRGGYPLVKYFTDSVALFVATYATREISAGSDVSGRRRPLCRGTLFRTTWLAA